MRDIARGVEESNVGVCCRYLIDHLSGIGHSDIDHDGYVNHLDAVERFYDMYPLVDPDQPELITWRNRIKRCRRALTTMQESGQNDAFAILHIVYGYPDPFVLSEFDKKILDDLGELASLVKYTEPVEVRRLAMARTEAIRLSNRQCKGQRDALEITTSKDDGFLQGQRDALEITTPPMGRHALSGSEDARRAINLGLPPQHGAPLIDFLRHKDYYAYTLAAISSTDALRAALAPMTDKSKDESQERYKERKDAHAAKQEVFVSQIKVEASKMLATASKVFHTTWLNAR